MGGDVRLADFIIREMPRILPRWDEFAGSLQRPGRTLDQHILRDHAEDILIAVVADLKAPQTAEQPSRKSKGLAEQTSQTTSRTHAVLRASKGFTIRHLV